MANKKNWLRCRLEYAFAVALIWPLGALPASIAAPLARTFGRFLDTLLPKLRRTARINLSFALPNLDASEQEEIIDGVFENVGRLLFALARFPRLDSSNIDAWISYEGLEHYLEAKQRGGGVLIATAHLGNWELSAFAHALMSEPMHVMVRALDNPLIDRLVEERRKSSGNLLIEKRDGARAVLRALHNNEAVGILIDQNTSMSEGVFVNFFGKLACAGSTFVKLAQRSRAPVIPGFALWNHAAKRYVLRFYPPVEITGDVIADTQHIHSLIEDVIRHHPDQWMWIHRRWKTRPPGEPPLY